MEPSQRSLSVFFPAYNEAENIESTVREADRVLRSLVREYEIIVVDDGSKDATGEIADRLARENPRVRVIHHSPNQGYGGAVWSGIQAARYEYIFFTDADLQFKLDELSLLLKHIPEHDIVIGYRAKRMDPFMRLVNAKGWNVLNRILFGLKVKDIDCAFKLMRASAVKDLPVRSRGAMLSAELLIRLARKGYTFKEVPVTHLPRLKGTPTGAKPAVILRAFREMLSVYRGDLGSKTLGSAIKFGLVGIVNTLVDWSVYYALTRTTIFFGDHLTYAKALSFFVGTIPSFVANRYWTFGKTNAVSAMEVTRFYVTNVVALVLNAATLFVFVHILGVYDLVGVIVATAVSFLWNFFVSKNWVFRSDADAAVSYRTPRIG